MTNLNHAESAIFAARNYLGANPANASPEDIGRALEQALDALAVAVSELQKINDGFGKLGSLR